MSDEFEEDLQPAVVDVGGMSKSGVIPFECTKTSCPAYSGCSLVPTQLVIGKKDKQDVILFVGDAPQRLDHEQALPFSSRTGDLLRDTIRKVNTRGASIAYTNIARYWPRDDCGETLKPSAEASSECMEHLIADVRRLKPTKIVALGSAVLKHLVPTADKIAMSRGRHFQHDELGTIFSAYHPSYIVRRQNLFEQWRNDLQVATGSEELSRQSDKWSTPYTWRMLETIESIEEYVEELLNNKKIKIIALDTETSGLEKRHGNKLGTFQLSEDGKRGTVIPYDHPKFGWWPDDRERLDIALTKLFTTPDPPWRYWVFHNTGFDYRMVYNFGPGVTQWNRPLLDVGMMAYCQDENRGKSGIPRPYSLDSLMRDYLKVNKYEDPEIESFKKQGKMLEIEPDRLAKYGASDAVYTARLFWYIREQAARGGYQESLIKLTEHWFAPVSRLNSIMSSNGFWVDMEQLRKLQNPKTSPIVTRMQELDAWWKTSPNARKTNKLLLRDKLGGRMKPVFGGKDAWEFDINKREAQLCLFFDVMKLQPLDYGKGTRTALGSKTAELLPVGKVDKAFQERYAGTEEVDTFHEHQGLKKLKTSYVASILGFLDPKNGKEGSKDDRVRPSFWVTTTDTGRSSCTEPNLQQIPRSLLYDTLLSTDKGLLQIGELVEKEGTASVSCLNKAQLITQKHTTTHKKAVTVTTRFGFSVTGSPQHKMLVWDSVEQQITDKKLSNLSATDYLLLGKGIFPKEEVDAIAPSSTFAYSDAGIKKHALPQKVTESFAKLLGYLVAGKDLRRETIAFLNQDRDIIADYVFALRKCFPSVHYSVNEDPRDGTYKVSFNSAHIFSFLEAQGCALTTAHYKEIPSCILRSPRNVILRFLEAYIEGDGAIGEQDIRFHSASKTLIKQLHVLTATLGWVGAVGEETNAQGHAVYKVVYYGDDARNMYETLNWVSNKQKSVNRDIVFSSDTKRFIPGLKKKLQYTLLPPPYPVPYLRPHDDPTKEFTASFLKRHPETVNACRKLGWHEALSVLDYVPVQVRAIEESKFSGNMYDLTVQDQPYYLANGLVSHNSDNWAKREIKNMYAAEPGCALIQLDFMTAEVRWWGILAQCPEMSKAFENGKRAREEYQSLCDIYVGKHPDLPYRVLEAGSSMLDDDFKTKAKNELKELKSKFTNAELKQAWGLIRNDTAFNDLCKAKAFAKVAGDIHKNTASQMYDVPITQVTKGQRTDTKSIVFGSMFGRGVKAIAQQLKVSDLDEVKKRINNFFAQFKCAEQWMFDTEDFAEKNGYVESPIGRRRRLITFQLGIADEGERARAKRIARNSPIQGISSDGAFLGAAMLNDYLIESGKWHVHPTKKCWLIEDVVHDSCVIQVPLEDVPEAIATIAPFFTSKLMERMKDVWGVNFSIPLEVDFEVGLKWGDLYAWDNTKLHMDYLMSKLNKENAERANKHVESEKHD